MLAGFCPKIGSKRQKKIPVAHKATARLHAVLKTKCYFYTGLSCSLQFVNYATI